MMEVNPVLDSNSVAQPGLWYVLSPENDGPSPRVGHSCLVMKNRRSSEEKSMGSEFLVIVGGANPDGAFNDSYVLDFEKYAWCKCNWAGLPERYEHAAFIPDHEPAEIIVFGGAKKDVNFNDIQILDKETKSWCIALPAGQGPSQRTCHFGAAIGDELFIFSGGKSGADPVQDDKLYVYNARSNSWSQPVVSGSGPETRHGHIMVAVKNCIYIHGGMAGTKIFADLWKLTVDGAQLTWSQPTISGDPPCERAAHAACTVGSNVFLFGGMNATGALDDLYSLNTDSFTWQKIGCEGPPPSSRLDHTMCAVTITRATDGSEEKPAQTEQTFLVVFGGMDTRGEIFDDCLAFLVG